MEAKELRLGNYVELQINIPEITTKEVSQVLRIEAESSEIGCFSDIIPDCDVWNIEDEQVKPIPLTEEWLLNFGFRKSHNIEGDTYHIMNKDGITANFTVEHWTRVKKDSEWNNHWYIRETIAPFGIKYIHELQNLYFALTGEELTLKT